MLARAQLTPRQHPAVPSRRAALQPARVRVPPPERPRPGKAPPPAARPSGAPHAVRALQRAFPAKPQNLFAAATRGRSGAAFCASLPAPGGGAGRSRPPERRGGKFEPGAAESGSPAERGLRSMVAPGRPRLCYPRASCGGARREQSRAEQGQEKPAAGGPGSPRGSRRSRTRGTARARLSRPFPFACAMQMLPFTPTFLNANRHLGCSRSRAAARPRSQRLEMEGVGDFAHGTASQGEKRQRLVGASPAAQPRAGRGQGALPEPELQRQAAPFCPRRGRPAGCAAMAPPPRPTAPPPVAHNCTDQAEILQICSCFHMWRSLRILFCSKESSGPVSAEVTD